MTTSLSSSTADTKCISASWLTAPATQAVFEALKAQGHLARAVGGAPRNTLAGLPVADIDIATTATPQETIVAADLSGLKSVPTGLAHGTITIIVDGKPFEVTTLREDVSTDGRHATVAFTDDWVRDAKRRDFTINALYVDPDGTVFDPVGGLLDLSCGQVRFIGDAGERIGEDYLRILRFFRFTSTFAAGAPDDVALEACKAARGGLDKLSGERVRSELLRLLVTRRAAEMVELMSDAGLFEVLLGLPVRTDHVRHLVRVEDDQSLSPDAVRRLAALAVRGGDDVNTLVERLRLTNVEQRRLDAIGRGQALPSRSAREAEMKARLYQIGIEAYQDTELLGWARSGDDSNIDWRFQRLELPEQWDIPQLPVSGGDVVALGVPAGPRVGEILSRFETWWIGADFPDDESIINDQLKSFAKDY